MTATLPELDVPYGDEPDDEFITGDKRYYKDNVIVDEASLSDNHKLGYLLLQAAKNNNDNNNIDSDDDDNNDEVISNNKGYIEQILNKDKEKLNKRHGSKIYKLVDDNNLLERLYNEKDSTVNDDNIALITNAPTDNTLKDNLVILNNQRVRRDGKN